MLILGFILGKLKKVTRWHCCWKILKKLIKVVITPLLSQLQGWPGGQKNRKMLRYLHLVFFCAKIEPKIEKIRKTMRKQGFFWGWFFVNFDSFLKFTQFWLNSSAKTEHPGHPWSCESSGVGKLRALSDTVCPYIELYRESPYNTVSISTVPGLPQVLSEGNSRDSSI